MSTLLSFFIRNLKGVTWKRRIKRSMVLEFYIYPFWAKMRGQTPLYILHINKAAGTSLRRAMAELDFKKGPYFPIWTPHRVGMPQIPPAYPVAFFVRNPASRAASGFEHVKARGAPYYSFENSESEKRAFEHFTTFDALVEGTLSPERAVRDEAMRAWKGIHHLRWSYEHFFQGVTYLNGEANRVLFVGSVEDMEVDWGRFFRFLGAETPAMSRLNKSKKVQRLHPSANEALNIACPKDLAIYQLLMAWRAKTTSTSPVA